MEHERPRPRVTVQDPSRTTSGDVVASSDDDRRPSPFTRRRLTVLVVVGLLVAATAGVLEVREQRAAAAEQRRLDQVVVLTASVGNSRSQRESPTHATVSLDLRLQNGGSRDVFIASGRSGAYLVPASAVVRAGDHAFVTLQREVPCTTTSAAPPVPEPLGVLELDLSTAGGGQRRVEVPLEASLLLVDETPQACAFLSTEPGGELGLMAAVVRAAPAERAVRVGLAVTDVEVRERTFELFAVDAGRGLTTRAASGTLLPPRLRVGPDVTDLDVAVTVADCAAARGTRPQLVLWVSTVPQRAARLVVPYDPALLRGLLSEVCPG